MFTRPLYLHRHVLDHTTRSDSGIRSWSTASSRHASQSSICIHCPCRSNRVRLVEDIDLFLSIGLRSCAHETDRPSHCLHPRLGRAMIGSGWDRSKDRLRSVPDPVGPRRSRFRHVGSSTTRGPTRKGTSEPMAGTRGDDDACTHREGTEGAWERRRRS